MYKLLLLLLFFPHRQIVQENQYIVVLKMVLRLMKATLLFDEIDL